MKVLLIDAGNSRIKWRVTSAREGFADHDPTGGVDADAIDALESAWSDADIRGAWLSNVAGEARGARLVALMQRRPAIPLHVLRPGNRQAGVTNSYTVPEKLGADRWAALLGARALRGSRELVIASFGTATTIDHLTAQGVFTGGVILPGFSLMRDSLSEGTADLPRASGQYTVLARATDDAITSGIAHAQLGALERLVRLLGARADGSASEHEVLLTGGAAARVLPLLPFPATIVDNLVLRGLLEVARETLS